MPLVQSQLADALASAASDPGSTVAECAHAWAEAIGSYASGVIPPSSTVSAAQSVLEGALAGAFASPAAAPLMEVAMLAFGASVGLGMAPAFVAVPPVAPVGFATQFAGPMPETHEQAGAALAALIDIWMKTGTANTIPPTSPVPWS